MHDWFDTLARIAVELNPPTQIRYLLNGWPVRVRVAGQVFPIRLTNVSDHGIGFESNRAIEGSLQVLFSEQWVGYPDVSFDVTWLRHLNGQYVGGGQLAHVPGTMEFSPIESGNLETGNLESGSMATGSADGANA